MVELEPDNPGRDEELLVQLGPDVVRTIDRSGGTILHSSRTNPASMSEKVLPATFDKSAHHPRMAADALCCYDLRR